MPVKEKAALLVPSGTYHEPDKKHLHIICSDPDAKGLVVIVGISTYTKRSVRSNMRAAST
jgi:hypothetical protein